MTSEEIRIIKEDIRSSYALPVRDHLEFSYSQSFPANEPARIALSLAHYNLFLSAISRNAAELAPLREMLHRLSERFGAGEQLVDEVNRSMIHELMKMTAFQRRNSADSVAAYNLVVAMVAHALWTALADQAPKQTRAA